MDNLIVHFQGYSVVDSDVNSCFSVNANIDLSKYEEKFKEAQRVLDQSVLNDSVSYMPIQTGMLQDRTIATAMSELGSGRVTIAVGPYGRFQYMGKVMVDPVTGSPWARKDAKKILTDRDIVYSNPRASAKWFDVAKAQHKEQWIAKVKGVFK